MEEKNIILIVFVLFVAVITLFYLRKDEQRDNYENSWDEKSASLVINTIRNMAQSGFCAEKGDANQVGICFQSKIAEKYTPEQYFSGEKTPEKRKYVRDSLFSCFQQAGCDVPH